MNPKSKILRPTTKDVHGQPLRPFRANMENNVSKAIDQLGGICKGILADGIVSDQEAAFFRDWITQHAELEPIWPWTDILGRVQNIFRDGIISDDEREDLSAIMRQISGTDGQKSEVEDKSMSLPLNDPQPPSIFPEHCFCVTGRFAFGTRGKVFEAITGRGGKAQESAPTRDTQFLVIGTFASRDWYYTSYGRKIERAVELRDAKNDIAIVSEEHWRTFIL